MKEIITNHSYMLPIFAYLLGSVPFGLIFSRLKGVDPRRHGSGNIGATNIARVLGKKWGIVTLVCDTVKGFLPVIIAIKTGQPSLIVALTGFLAVVGHCYSIFLFFNGGKGVATALGVFLAISPISVALAAVVFGLAVYNTRYVSVGSLAAVATMPLLIFFLKGDSFLEAMSWSICFVVWIRHKDNIARLIKGEEKRISFGSQEP